MLLSLSVERCVCLPGAE